MGILLSLLIGALGGYLGSRLFGTSLSLLWCILVGIVGGMLGGWICGDLLGIGGGNIIWQIIEAALGTFLLLWIISLVKK